jgi:uncharacterized protein YecA (UPF0149 family)
LTVAQIAQHEAHGKFCRCQPCRCGSGKKYKHCHSAIRAAQPAAARPRDFDEQLDRAMRRSLDKGKQSEEQQDFGKPNILAEVACNRVVTVGLSIYSS